MRTNQGINDKEITKVEKNELLINGNEFRFKERS